MALAAALPRDWPPVRIYFGIVIIFSVIGWTGLARVIRGKLLSLREEDFVMAARIAGAKQSAIIGKHLLPSFTSYIIVSLTLAIPQTILGETALSFLGLGPQPPVVSWGVLLQDAQNVQAIAHHGWLLIPCLFVIVTVLMFNFLGDGLRDAADPYSRQESTAMHRFAFAMKLKPGFAAEYQRRHDEIWPELAREIREADVSDYSIYLDPDSLTLFAVQKLSPDHTAGELPESPVVKKWWAYMADIMDTNPDNSPVMRELPEVFHLD